MLSVRIYQQLDRARDLVSAGPLRRRLRVLRGGRGWPVVPGAYVVGDPDSPVAVCTLTSNELIQPLAGLPGVAIAGRVYTPNLGIERIVVNLTANVRIRFLLLVGKESPVFHPGQSIRALFAGGATRDDEHRIVGAIGPLPVLRNLPRERIDQFRNQLELVDRMGTLDPETISREVQSLVRRNPGPFEWSRAKEVTQSRPESGFVAIRPGGKRQPLVYDPNGFFVVGLDRNSGEIVIRHYTPDNRPAHEMRGRSAETMLLGLLREKLISQMSHAAYIGGELAKAEAATRLGLEYEQDQPLRLPPQKEFK